MDNNSLSSKDISYISDIFNWNYTILKYCNDIFDRVNSNDIKNFVERVKNMHLNICNDLICMLGGNNE